MMKLRILFSVLALVLLSSAVSADYKLHHDKRIGIRDRYHRLGLARYVCGLPKPVTIWRRTMNAYDRFMEWSSENLYMFSVAWFGFIGLVCASVYWLVIV